MDVEMLARESILPSSSLNSCEVRIRAQSSSGLGSVISS